MQSHVEHQASNDEKNLIKVQLQMESIGKEAAMVIACIEHRWYGASLDGTKTS
jgi:hypothetical protein